MLKSIWYRLEHDQVCFKGHFQHLFWVQFYVSFLLIAFVVVFFYAFRSLSSGFHWKQGQLLSGYIVFTAKILDNVPSSFKEELSKVLVFLTMLKSLSNSASLWGITSTSSASLIKYLKRFTGHPGIHNWAICYHKISTL